MMAYGSSAGGVFCAAVVAVLFLAQLVALAGASTMALFDVHDTRCSGVNSVNLTCGVCHSIEPRLRGGYDFRINRAYANVYYDDNCDLDPIEGFVADTRHCGYFDYKRIFLDCELGNTTTAASITLQRRDDMATINSYVFLAMAVVVAVAAAIATLAGASSLTVFEMSDCGGQRASYSSCGCSNIDYHGGFQFSFDGDEWAYLFDGPGCDGDPAHLHQSEQHCGKFAYQSVNMCAPAVPPRLHRFTGAPTTAGILPY